MKMLMLKDMKDMGFDLNRTFLRKHGFNYNEINYLINKGEAHD